MCSILGILDPSGISEEVHNQADLMLSIMQSRGPDSVGKITIGNSVLLGSTRLSIVDLSTHGKMPITDVSQRFHIVLNGEIYNFASLKNELSQSSQNNLKSKSDTEVLLYLLIEFGVDIIPKLNGMFAFIFYDSVKNEVIFCRDRLGIKPLYYYLEGKKIVIASDIRSFMALPGFDKRLDAAALTAFINLRFIPAPNTIFTSIKKLIPGTYVKMILGDDHITPTSYWTPKCHFTDKTEEDLLEIMEGKIRDAVQHSMTGEAEVGVLLSGGLDSSAVYLYAKKFLKKLQVFTCDYSVSEANATPTPNSSTDLIHNQSSERQFAQLMTDQEGDFLNTIQINLTDIREVFDNMIWDMGEPMASTDAIGHYLLAKNLPKDVKVALSGIGADELLGGYVHMFLDGGDFLNKKRSPYEYLTKFANPGHENSLVSGVLSKKYRNEEALIGSVSEGMNQFDIDTYPQEGINYHMFFELLFDLPGWELAQADSLYMAFSKEVRPVFLENDFVDFCMSLPAEFKFREGIEKYLFKKALAKVLPDEIVSRKKLPSLGTPLQVFKSAWFEEKYTLALRNEFDILDSDYLLKNDLDIDFDIKYRIVVLDTWLRMMHSATLKQKVNEQKVRKA
jgi:asparagine synthase (glutamine-hydrolysing)